jgi:four helix bundle protein
MARPKNSRQLIAWQKAMVLARNVYRICEALQSNQHHALANQMRRAALSIPSNIAERHGRLTDLQFRHFLGNARGSLCELETQLELTADLGYLDMQRVHSLIEQTTELARIINGLVASITRARAAVRANPANAASSANSAPVGLS